MTAVSQAPSSHTPSSQAPASRKSIPVPRLGTNAWFVIIAAILFGMGFFFELLNQSQHYVWLFLLSGLFFLAVAAATGGPVITINRRQ